MKLDELAQGRVYVDTNVLYMYLRYDPAHLPVIKTFLKRVANGEIAAFVGITVFDELFYRLLLARIGETTNRNPLEVLRENRVAAMSSHVDAINSALRRLVLVPNLQLVGVSAVDLHSMLDNIKAFSLLPRDALHLATLQRLGLTDIASDDKDFDRVEGLHRHWVFNSP